MIFIIWLLNTTIRFSNDTLFFVSQDTVIDQWILNKDAAAMDSLGITSIEKVKIDKDSIQVLFYQEEYERATGHSKNVLYLFSADKDTLWIEKGKNERRVRLDLSTVEDDILIVAESDLEGKNTSVDLIQRGSRIKLIEANTWLRVIGYALSQNHRYILFHTYQLHCDRPWDFLYFRDIESGHEWQYFFPTCLSCKKTPINLNVDNAGQSEVIYKQEHRIFSKEGALVRIFFE
jgi:hypothetical protein